MWFLATSKVGFRRQLPVFLADRQRVLGFWDQSDADLKTRFFALQSRKDVADLLGLTPRKLSYTLWGIGVESLYHEFEIPKRSGGTRLISAPSGRVLEYQRRLKRILDLVYNRRTPVRGFVKGESIASNAAKHVGKRWVLNADLKDFFPSIHFGRVRGLFMAEPYNLGRDAATALARLACFRGALPVGGATSPVIANMICVGLDGTLLRLARECGSTYTRYADDLTFSTHRSRIDSRLASANPQGEWQSGDALRTAIESHGFRVNESKTRAMSSKDRQVVTGLVVNRKLNVDRRFVRRLRAALHDLEQTMSEPSQRQREVRLERSIRGRLGLMRMVKGPADPLAIRMGQQLENILGGRPKMEGAGARSGIAGDRVVRILHLSDFHFSSSTSWDSVPVLGSLTRYLSSEELAVDVIVVTGDLAHSGMPDEYERTSEWLVRQLLPAIGLTVERLLIVPGNHDVDRSRINASVSSIRSAIRSANEADRDRMMNEIVSDTTQLDLLARPFAAYLDFADSLIGDQGLFWSREIEINGAQLMFAGLCSAIVSDDQDAQGNQVVSLPQVRSVTAREGEVSIALLHHPPIWLDETDREAITVLEQWSDIILHGHEHSEQLSAVTGHRTFLRFGAGAGYQGSRHRSGVQLYELDVGSRKLSVVPFRRHLESGSWHRSRDIFPNAPEGMETFDLPPSR